MRLLALRTVVVAVDLDGSSDAALDTAHRLAKAAGGALHVVHVLSPAANADPSNPAAAEAAVRAALPRAGIAGEPTIHVLAGPPVDAIRLFADRVAADVVVVGSRRQRDNVRGTRHLGGTAGALVERAFVPCLVTTEPLRLPLDRVLVPIDASDTARGALVAALSWASALRRPGAGDEPTTLTVLHVHAAGDEARRAAAATLERELATLGERAGSWAGVVMERIALEGADAAEAIAAHAAANPADLVVVGTRGLGLDDVARLGSVSASLTMRLSSPMLLVPPGVWRAYAAEL